MLQIKTPTRILENWSLYGSKKETVYHDDQKADKLLETCYAQWKNGFIVKMRADVFITNPTVIIPVEKPTLQTTIETASPKERRAAEDENKSKDLAVAERLRSINLRIEMESWLGTRKSEATQKTYYAGIKKFFKYCETHGINPVMVSPSDTRVYVNWLKANGESIPSIRVTLIACRNLFEKVWENHEIAYRKNPFSVKGLLPPKERVKPLQVPDQAEVDKILKYAKKDVVVFTALKLIVKHGFRIGAFEKMRVKGKKVVTVTKGKNLRSEFDDEDVKLWEANPLGKYTAKQLDDRVNYLLKQAYQCGITQEQYSVHKFRHFVAIKIYKEVGNICAVSKKLGHSHIRTSETYLESLKDEGHL